MRPEDTLPPDAELVARLRAGDEDTFARVVRAWSPGMLHLARRHVADDATAVDAVQETWLAVLNGIDRFEERSSLKTWIFRILVNKAKTRGVREARTVPFSALTVEGDEPAVPEDRFRGADDQWPGHWSSPPRPLDTLPEQRLLGREVRQHLVEALDDPDAETRISVIWALGSSGDASAIPHVERMYASGDAGVRKMAVYALGALPGDAQLETLQHALEDDAVDVRWNAAVGLARHLRPE